ncbi:MAG: hypothetical protein ACTTGJ_03890, partial [Clostridium sp.]
MKKSKRDIFRELNNRCFNNLRYKLQIFKKDIVKKIIASTMIITMSSTNMLYVFKSGYVYAANNIVNSKLYKDAKTNVNDVDVLMSLNNNVSNDNQTFNLVGNVKERNYLDIYIRVKDIGVLQGGVLELEILNKKSFKLEDYTLNTETDINNKSKQELKRQLDPQNIVEKVEGNKIYLNQIKKDNINENN